MDEAIIENELTRARERGLRAQGFAGGYCSIEGSHKPAHLGALGSRGASMAPTNRASAQAA